jgi:DNA-binding PadR family transcriptional regulator
MSAKHALLGLLLNKPAYPYELGNRLEARLGPSWLINSGQLYQTIGKLAEGGLIERIDVAADDRHLYQITGRGEEEFERWFEGPPSTARLSRRPLLVKITLGGPERLEDALKQLDAYELDLAARLKDLSSEQEDIPLDEVAPVRADHVLRRLNLSADVCQLEGELRWAKLARETISLLLSREAIWPSAAERSAASTDASRARKELFGRMAARGPAINIQSAGSEDPTMIAGSKSRGPAATGG